MIEIVPYQERWKAEFTEIAGRIRAAVGDAALRIDHIGSTAVPGLAAKDIIDIQMTVADFESISEIRQRLEAAGFVWQFGGIGDHFPPGWSGDEREWEKHFFNAGAGQRRVNLHVRGQGRANQRYALLFRDYLRAHPPVAAAYAAVKHKLVEYLGQADDITPYVDIKDPVVDIISAQAEEWATRTGWTFGASDA